eukprot:TRINITY_DN10164_c0_g1_i1.p1 TRINITY_DN10164_c0_g1~~TRINITY_DN10164_c0_g1_i1.p1  ORF type:complete len:571 (-),score=91.28 TRINITY_DN10164_c0_g1_i1:164-1771(-)
MLSLSEMIKDGTRHISGKNEAILQNIEAVKNLAEITRTSLGPHGMNKMIVNHLEKLFVTNDAATILKELDVIHPAAKIAVLAAHMQEQEVGDGTNFVLIFVGELLQKAEALIQKGLHSSEIIAGYTAAGKKAQELLEKMTCLTVDDPRNSELVTKVLRSIITAKQFGYEDLLAPIIARACLSVLPSNPKNFNVDNVRVAKILGGGVMDTSVIKGHVVVRDTETTIKQAHKCKIAVFAAGIETAKTETKDTVKITDAESLMNYNKGEEKAIEDVIQKVSDAGIKVVISGGPVSEMALHFIERHQIMCVKILSKFELRRLCKAVGATSMLRLGAPTAEETGYCDSVTVQEIGSTKVTIFKQDTEDSGISTILVRAATQNILDDIERAIDDGVNVYKGLVKDGRFVPGAAASEIALSKALGQFADSTPGLTQHAIRRYSDAFQVIPRTIAENAGLKATDVISSLYAAHQKGEKNTGIDVEDGVVADVDKLLVYDLLSTKQNAIRLATEAAVTILRVDQIIMSKTAGGPKPPQQGPRDG